MAFPPKQGFNVANPTGDKAFNGITRQVFGRKLSGGKQQPLANRKGDLPQSKEPPPSPPAAIKPLAGGAPQPPGQKFGGKKRPGGGSAGKHYDTATHSFR